MSERIVKVVAPSDGVELNSRLLSARFCIASETEDRDGDVIIVKGVDCEQHRRNPIVLLNHNIENLIGTSESPDGAYTVDVVGSKIYATCYYQQDTQLGVQTFALVDKGFLRGASVGVMVGETLPRGQARGRRQPMTIVTCTLYEWSNTPLPSNPDTVREVLSLGKIEGQLLHPVLRKQFESYVTEAAPAVVSGWEGGQSPMVSIFVPADALSSLAEVPQWLRAKGVVVGDAPTVTTETGSQWDVTGWVVDKEASGAPPSRRNQPRPGETEAPPSRREPPPSLEPQPRTPSVPEPRRDAEPDRAAPPPHDILVLSKMRDTIRDNQRRLAETQARLQSIAAKLKKS